MKKKPLLALWQHLGPKRRRQFFILVVVAIFASIAEMISLGAIIPFLTILSNPDMLIGDGVLARVAGFFNISNNGSALFLFGCIFGFSALLSGGMRIALARANTEFAVQVGSELASAVFSRALGRDYEEHISTNTSAVISAITAKVNAVIFKVILPSLMMINSIILACALGATLIIISASVSLFALGSLALVYLIIIKVAKKLVVSDGNTIARESNNVLRIAQEALGGIRDVLIDQSASFHVDRFTQADKRLRRAQGRNAFLAIVPRFIAESVGLFCIAMIATWYALRSEDLSSVVPVLGALALAAQRLLPMFQQVFAAWTAVQVSIASLEDLLQFLIGEEKIPAEIDRCAEIRFDTSIELHNVAFRYRGADANVLENISLKIPKGACVGLIGKSGSGKSTLVDILMGLLSPTSGEIRIDGIPVTNSNRWAWWNLIAHVPQSVFVADRSVSENILLSRHADDLDDVKIREVLKLAQLDEFLTTIDNGICTNLGERGNKISGGQRQRLGIARALFKDAQLIIFDEATNGLDRATESALIDAIGDICSDRTVIMIAHRYETLKNCDYIFQLSFGGVEFMGSYSDFISKKATKVKG